MKQTGCGAFSPMRISKKCYYFFNHEGHNGMHKDHNEIYITSSLWTLCMPSCVRPELCVGFVVKKCRNSYRIRISGCLPGNRATN